jgi:hypothetical protein
MRPQTCITRLWCSSRSLQFATAAPRSSGTAVALTLCSMVNRVLRSDAPPPLMTSCARIVRTMRDTCHMCAASLSHTIFCNNWSSYAPSQGVSHRGCAMSSAGLAFFAPGMKFRVPCFLSTCTNRDAAARHCHTAAFAAAADQLVPVMWHIQCQRRSGPSFLTACLPMHSSPRTPPSLMSSSRVSLLRSSGTPSRVSPARVSLLYNSSNGSINSDPSRDISLQEAAADERTVCHSALWLQGSDVFLYAPCFFLHSFFVTS